MALTGKGLTQSGSVKILTIQKKATEQAMGVGVFQFTDDYSIFDYGKMPDPIPGKGESLCRQAAYNFEQLEKLGIPSHYRRLVSSTEMEVNLVRILFPQKGELRKGMGNYLVPLEVIFRNSLPAGSSVFKRLQSGQLPLSQLGLKEMPRPGARLPKPIMDVSTKLEPTDRYLSWEEALELSCLSRKEIEELKDKALRINDFISGKAEEIGLEHADGKVEFGYTPDKKLVLVDVAGTLDEDRMLYKGVHVSKQVVRDYYKTTPWYAALEAAKARGQPKEQYPVPEHLPRELLEITGNLYKSVCEAWTGRKTWGAPAIQAVVDDYLAFLDQLKVRAR
ncbi:MAG TPA: phosphoribosylaminoimidazolesuccinocarboxamide synthase [Candidatus Diapherotrites archaeon]|uniref:Phosphoribosylaminoimidazole-succinocarboxamide synthase n=1 Tax=Candidatus Iainarchaeum sp. TaxID=3101447 RepID=A0A7J4JF82_9ARCH|nr:phosphoribosylaminoimidazolesuccinocarboxamide synthase [Candidatus Diapherotrites archaeon]HIH16378.1 phosphoribosylaminoimidazolesuccinocarboxamide synthase [Candidatus Diapherotrites archaeon]